MGGREAEYVQSCLQDNWVSSVGPMVDRFELLMAQRAGTRHAVATVNGTAALHIALMIAGVQAEDEVVVPTLTFIATANAVRYLNAWPVLVDVEPRYWQIDPQLVEDFLREGCRVRHGRLYNRVTGRRVAAILPVHLLGHPADMDALNQIAAHFELPVIEDAAEALGATYKQRPVGSLGKIGCFSFNGNKIITTGGGGMLTTADDHLAARARYLTTQAKNDPREYVHDEVGYNYRLPNVLAAMGCGQLEVLDAYVDAKRRIAASYVDQLRDLPGVGLFAESPGVRYTAWLSTIVVDEQRTKVDSRQLMQHLVRGGIQSRPLWQPMHHSPAHRQAFSIRGGVAERIHRQALSLPSSVNLSDEQMSRVTQAIRTAAS